MFNGSKLILHRETRYLRLADREPEMPKPVSPRTQQRSAKRQEADVVLDSSDYFAQQDAQRTKTLVAAHQHVLKYLGQQLCAITEN